MLKHDIIYFFEKPFQTAVHWNRLFPDVFSDKKYLLTMFYDGCQWSVQRCDYTDASFMSITDKYNNNENNISCIAGEVQSTSRHRRREGKIWKSEDFIWIERGIVSRWCTYQSTDFKVLQGGKDRKPPQFTERDNRGRWKIWEGG